MTEPPIGTDAWIKWLISEVMDGLSGRLRGNDKFETPPDGFRALRATAEQIARFGLPPRPNPESESEAHAAWQRLFAPEPESSLNFVKYADPLLDDDWAHNSHRLTRAGPFRSMGHTETSRNWSGAVATVDADSRFRQIFGSWRVPTVKRPAGGADGDYRCSIWIGLDGHRRHLKSIAQLGTTQRIEIVGGVETVICEPWYQWWLRDQKFPPIPFANFPVRQEDHVSCCLTVLEPDLVQFFIVNHTARRATGVQARRPTAKGEDQDFDLRCVSAEWIAERPTHKDSHELHPLPDYGSVTIKNCVATMDNGQAPRGLAPAKRVRMIAEHAAPPGATVISSATKVDDHSVQTSFCV